MPWLVALATVAAGNVLLKALPRAPWVLADSYTHLYVAAQMRAARSWRIRLDRFLYDQRLDRRLDYPPLFGALLALLLGSGSPRRREHLARWLPALLDTAALLVASGSAFWLGGAAASALVAEAIWLFSPCTHAQTLALSGRPVGSLLATITFAGLAMLMIEPSAWGVVATVFAGALLFLANRLAVQAWAILTVAFALGYRSALPVAVMGGSLAAATLLTGGDFWRVHLGHWRHMKRLRRLMPKKGWHQVARFSRRRAAPPRAGGFRALARVLTILDLPFVWVLVAALAISRFAPLDGPVGRVCWLWLVTLVGGGAVIQAVPGLRFVGEGFRYFEFAIVPLAVLVTRAISMESGSTRRWVAAVAIGATLAGCSQIYRGVRASFLTATSRDPRAVRLAERLRGTDLDRLLVLPLQYAPLLAVEGDKQVLMMLDEVAADRSEDFYPLMERAPASFVAEFRLGGVWVDRRYVEPEELGLDGLDPVDEEGPFACFALRNQNRGTLSA